MIALIPARAGSKRIPGKNTKLLAGHPLIAYTIAAAQQSGAFSRIIVSTDDAWLKGVVMDMGTVAVHDRNPKHATDNAPDILWVRDVLAEVDSAAFAILRPTSPFRTAETIRRACAYFTSVPCSSIRAVERTRQHPGKMWQSYTGTVDTRIMPLMGEYWPYPAPMAPLRCGETPWHSQPTQSLPSVYVQNASLEMAWTWCVTTFGTISGPRVYGFETQGYEGFDINEPRDWREAEYLIASGEATLPEIHVAA